MSKQHTTIQEYVNNNSFIDVVIKSHSHGVRLEIHDRWKTTVSVVEATIDLAWKEALKDLPAARQRQDQKEIKRYQEDIAEKQKEIKENKRKIEQLKEKSC